MNNCSCSCHQSRGRAINRRAWLGAQIVSLRQTIPQLEKEARRTPPKHLVKERAKVEEAKRQLPIAQKQLADFLPEWEELRQHI